MKNSLSYLTNEFSEYFLEINEKDRQILYFLKDKRKSDSEEGIWNSEWFAIVSLELVY